MDAKSFTDEVLGPCHLDRYDSCGKHQSFFNYGTHCDKWQDYYYAVAATIERYQELTDTPKSGMILSLHAKVEALPVTLLTHDGVWVRRGDVLALFNGDKQ